MFTGVVSFKCYHSRQDVKCQKYYIKPYFYQIDNNVYCIHFEIIQMSDKTIITSPTTFMYLYSIMGKYFFNNKTIQKRNELFWYP
jgi:hypothetical protein